MTCDNLERLANTRSLPGFKDRALNAQKTFGFYDFGLASLFDDHYCDSHSDGAGGVVLDRKLR